MNNFEIAVGDIVFLRGFNGKGLVTVTVTEMRLAPRHDGFRISVYQGNRLTGDLPLVAKGAKATVRFTDESVLDVLKKTGKGVLS